MKHTFGAINHLLQHANTTLVQSLFMTGAGPKFVPFQILAMEL